MLAGLERVDGGRIAIGERDVTHLPPRDRDIAMVFQNYALYPHMSVADNMGFALRVMKVPKDETHRRVREAARLLDLEEFLDRKPKALSGGQRQRVAMGRAIVREPKVFLMDEPLSNLDAKLRVQTRTQIAALQRRLGVTTVYVTHDQVEAMTMGDRVAVLKDGVLQQVDTPLRLYQHPANVFVAGFIGSPSMNLAEYRSKATRRSSASTRVRLTRETLKALKDEGGDRVILGFRPESVEVVGEGDRTRELPGHRHRRRGTRLGRLPLRPVRRHDRSGTPRTDRHRPSRPQSRRRPRANGSGCGSCRARSGSSRRSPDGGCPPDGRTRTSVPARHGTARDERRDETQIVRPPSTGTTAPVTYEARSLSSQAAASATSSGSATRRSGVPALNSSRWPGPPDQPLEHRGPGGARGDGVDPDALGPVLDGGGLGEAVHRPFGGGVRSQLALALRPAVLLLLTIAPPPAVVRIALISATMASQTPL